ncbi:outer membrane protein assembly factor BamC [Elongatibacter sediminis]|uniref:Outer membrane protein assembly factor BamC n=1 Tax=Elongatibacter sediminis TaxID=3119006 RepID=A0AAW9RJA9_9GAMM
MNPPSKNRPGKLLGNGQRQLLVCALLFNMLLLSGCGLFGFGKDDDEDQPEYYEAVEAPPLEIPEGLARPGAAGALVITTPPAPLPQRELQSVPPRVSSTSTGKNQNAVLRWGSDGAYLLVEDSASSVQRRLGFVIKRAGMGMRELDSGAGYEVEYWHQPKSEKEGFFSRLAFWRDDAPNYSGTYRVTVREEGEKARVYVKNADGSEPDPAASEHILVVLGERLG